MLSRKVTDADGGILRVKFDTFMPQGSAGAAFSLSSNPVGYGGISAWTDTGPYMWWSNSSFIYGECINFKTNCDPGQNPGATWNWSAAVTDYGQDVWQHVQLDIDLVKDKYDVYHSIGDEPLKLAEADIGFNSGKLAEIDRFHIWTDSRYAVSAYFDNIDVTWSPSSPYTAIPLSGAGGTYVQDFDTALGIDATVTGQPLPTGWTGSRDGYFTSDTTTKPFPIVNITKGNLIFNAGTEQSPDRALGLGIGTETSQGTLQLLANVTDADAKQLAPVV